jgi:hypothetical protein
LKRQFWCREKRVPFIDRIVQEIQQHPKAEPIYSFLIPRVVFFLALQDRKPPIFPSRNLRKTIRRG